MILAILLFIAAIVLFLWSLNRWDLNFRPLKGEDLTRKGMFYGWLVIVMMFALVILTVNFFGHIILAVGRIDLHGI